MRLLLLFVFSFLSEMALARTAPICALSGVEGSSRHNNLKAMLSLPTPAFFVYEKAGYPYFLAPAAAYAAVLGVPERSIILNSIEELRFIPQTLARSSVLLVINESPDWTDEKSEKVLAVSKLLGIKISLLWLGEETAPRPVRDLVEITGGQSFAQEDLMKKVESACQTSVAAH